jgi:hypothetical protein
VKGKCRLVSSLAAAASLLVAASAARADGYFELLPWSTLNSGGASTSHFAHAIDGQTSFHQLTLNGTARITRVDNLGGTPSVTELVTTTDWVNAGGQSTSMLTIYGFSAVGSDLLFAETTTDIIWRVNQESGAISQYASQSAMTAATGGSSAQLLASNGVTTSGEMVFYEGVSDSILLTNGPGAVSVLISSAALNGLQGNTTVSGGLTMDAAGTLYWGNNTSDSIFGRMSGGSLGLVLGASDITAVTGGTSAGFADIFAAPDGLVYFVDTASDSILSFDPADPDATLATVLSASDLLSGPAASTNVFQLGWYGDSLSFNVNGTGGLYVIPEPASAAMLVIPATALLLRRRTNMRV